MVQALFKWYVCITDSLQWLVNYASEQQFQTTCEKMLAVSAAYIFSAFFVCVFSILQKEGSEGVYEVSFASHYSQES